MRTGQGFLLWITACFQSGFQDYVRKKGIEKKRGFLNVFSISVQKPGNPQKSGGFAEKGIQGSTQVFNV